jgi:hypothetical protein
LHPASAAALQFQPEQVAFAYSGRHAPSDLGARLLAIESPTLDPATPDQPLPGRDAVHRYSRHELCTAAASVAHANNLPIPFFANLIQQESGWRLNVVSPAGAQGIAQFMPRVAQSRGLHNPFDPIHALLVSGRVLADLVRQFGNLGLAAAAYNAGPKRVHDWIAKRGKLPEETRNYVRNITGYPAERWTIAKAASTPLPPLAHCPDAETRHAQALELKKPVIKLADLMPKAHKPGKRALSKVATLTGKRQAPAAKAAPKTVAVAALQTTSKAPKNSQPAGHARTTPAKPKAKTAHPQLAQAPLQLTPTLAAKPKPASKHIALKAAKPVAGKRIKVAVALRH